MDKFETRAVEASARVRHHLADNRRSRMSWVDIGGELTRWRSEVFSIFHRLCSQVCIFSVCFGYLDLASYRYTSAVPDMAIPLPIFASGENVVNEQLHRGRFTPAFRSKDCVLVEHTWRGLINSLSRASFNVCIEDVNGSTQSASGAIYKL